VQALKNHEPKYFPVSVEYSADRRDEVSNLLRAVLIRSIAAWDSSSKAQRLWNLD
jgi:hypothetical protein